MKNNLLKMSSVYIFSAFLLGGCSSSSSGSEEGGSVVCEEDEVDPIYMTAGEDHFINLASTNRIRLSGNAISTIGAQIDSYSWASADGLQITNNDEREAFVVITDSFASDNTEFTLTVVDSLGNESVDTISYAILNHGSSVCEDDEVERRTAQSIYRLGVNSLGNSRDFDVIELNDGDSLSMSFNDYCLSPIPLSSIAVSVRSSRGNFTEITNGGKSLSVVVGDVDSDVSATVSVRYIFEDGSLQTESFAVDIANFD